MKDLVLSCSGEVPRLIFDKIIMMISDDFNTMVANIG